MIIGFAGPKRSGKDYAYGIIKSYFPYIERIAFADPIKEKICDIFNIKKDELENLKTQTNLSIKGDNDYGLFSGRELLTGIGMLMRGYNEHQFEAYVETVVKKNPDKLYICTDVRFQSEVNLIHSLGGTVIQIHRNGVEYEMSETEKGINNYDYLIENGFTFEKDLIAIIGEILIKGAAKCTQ